MTTTVTLGLLTVGLLVLAVRVAHFWSKSKSRDWKELLPFLSNMVIFAAVGACAGGLLGTLTGWVRSALGWAGDKGLEYGTGAAQVSATRAAGFGELNAFGAVLMLLGLGIAAVIWKSAKKKVKKEIGWGGISGLALGPFVGAITLVPILNEVGTSTVGAFFNGG